MKDAETAFMALMMRMRKPAILYDGIHISGLIRPSQRRDTLDAVKRRDTLANLRISHVFPGDYAKPQRRA
jgi:hypothetical protein